MCYTANRPKMSLKSHVFLSPISQKATAHRFSSPGHLVGIETVFSPKTNTFSDRRKEVI